LAFAASATGVLVVPVGSALVCVEAHPLIVNTAITRSGRNQRKTFDMIQSYLQFSEQAM
jgi:hypothetical protein